MNTLVVVVKQFAKTLYTPEQYIVVIIIYDEWRGGELHLAEIDHVVIADDY